MGESIDYTFKAVQEENWFLDHYNMTGLARALIDSGHIPNLDIMLEYVEKPWKWTAEWEHYREHGDTHTYDYDGE